jgi:hypothetical protein
MRFTSLNDFNTIIQINKELMNDIIDITVILYKLNSEESSTNSYGESTKKIWYTGVEAPARIERRDQTVVNNMNTIDTDQDCTFSFLREELKDREIYPEEGDIIGYDGQYYEIHNINENQFWAGKVDYNFSLVCETHLTRKTSLQLEKPNL